jgi:hypothetical protein
MKTRDWYLTCLMEECLEINLEAHMVIGALEASLEPDSTALNQELADLIGVFSLVTERGVLPFGPEDKTEANSLMLARHHEMICRIEIRPPEGIKVILGELITAVSQLGIRVSKALRFGVAEVQPGQALNNGQRIFAAYSQVMGIGFLLNTAGWLSLEPGTVPPASQAKIAKVEKFLGYARKVGVVEDEAC